MKVYLGFYLGHDSNVAVSIDGKIKYRKSERYFGIKHHKANYDFVLKTLQDWGLSPKDITYCAFTDGYRQKIGICENNQLHCKGFLKEFPSFCIDHHYSHILSAWPVLETKKAQFGIAIDGEGDNRRSLKIIKNIYSNPKVTYEEIGPRLGIEFSKMGGILNFSGKECDFAGKLMGLHAYSEEEIVKFCLKKLKNCNTKNLISRIEGGKYETLNEWHNYWLEYLLKLFESHFNKEDCIIYSGGCAQNSVFNYALNKVFKNLYIPPHCYDGGLSLGCLEFLRLHFNEEEFCKEGFPYWQDDEVKEIPNEYTIKKAANLLAEGKIIGWAQGRGEIGPRALGNRSILMNVKNGENKNILNNKIKKREPWRPYAGSVLEEKSNEYFDKTESKYMLHACNVISKEIPAVSHVDGTCRMQTVSKKDNPIFYMLIEEYYNITKTPIILNTSLNVMGKPIASSKKQVIELCTTKLDALFYGNKILKKIKLI